VTLASLPPLAEGSLGELGDHPQLRPITAPKAFIRKQQFSPSGPLGSTSALWGSFGSSVAALLGRKPKAATLTFSSGHPRVRVAASRADGPLCWDTVLALKEKLGFGCTYFRGQQVIFLGQGHRGLEELARWLTTAALSPPLRVLGLALNAMLGH